MRNKFVLFFTLCILICVFIQIGYSQQTTRTKTKPPRGAISAKPDTIKLGDKIELKWLVKGADHIEIMPGIGRVDSTGSISLTPINSTLYKLKASNAGGDLNYTTQVTVLKYAPLPQVEFGVVSDTVTEGEKAKLIWNISGAHSVSIQGIGKVELNGSRDVFPKPPSKYYFLKAIGPGGEVAKSVLVVVVKPKAGKSKQKSGYIYPSKSYKPLKIKTIGLHFGSFFPEGNWDTGFFAIASFALQKTSANSYFQPYFGYKISSYTKQTDNDISYDLAFSDLIVGINYLFIVKKVSRKSEIYAGPGLSYNFITSEYFSLTSFGAEPEIKEKTGNKAGFGIMVGIKQKLGPIVGNLETKYEYIHGGYNNILISFGILFNIN